MTAKKDEPKAEAKGKSETDKLHDRIDRLEALMRANGWSVDD